MARCSAPLLAVVRAYASTVAPPDGPLCAARVSLRLHGASLPLFASVGCVAHAAAAAKPRHACAAHAAATPVNSPRTILLHAAW